MRGLWIDGELSVVLNEGIGVGENGRIVERGREFGAADAAGDEDAVRYGGLRLEV